MKASGGSGPLGGRSPPRIVLIPRIKIKRFPLSGIPLRYSTAGLLYRRPPPVGTIDGCPQRMGTVLYSTIDERPPPVLYCRYCTIDGCSHPMGRIDGHKTRIGKLDE